MTTKERIDLAEERKAKSIQELKSNSEEFLILIEKIKKCNTDIESGQDSFIKLYGKISNNSGKSEELFKLIKNKFIHIEDLKSKL